VRRAAASARIRAAPRGTARRDWRRRSSFALRRAEAQGGDPGELRLRLDAEGPRDAPAQRTDVPVEFVTFVDRDIDRVTIEGVAGPIPVDVLT
jgi:hypothetical protein